MSRVTATYWLLVALFGLALVIHVQFLGGHISDLDVADVYSYEQDLAITGSVGGVRMRMYVPRDELGLEIRDESFESADLDLDLLETPAGRLVVVAGSGAGRGQQIRYRAQLASTATSYVLDPAIGWDAPVAADSMWLAPTATIQSSHADIAALAVRLLEPGIPPDGPPPAAWTARQWQTALDQAQIGPVDALGRIFAHAHEDIRPAAFSGTTDALTALRLGESSCGGKTRLLVALCRRVGLPARIVGGVIMNQGGRKRVQHLWTEVRLDGTWVPCDPLNGHFAYRPATFLPLYRGDEPLIRHARGLTFDYGFRAVRNRVPLVWLGESGGAGESSGALVPLLDRHRFSAILLAPLCLLFIVFVRQVVGLESIGTFLPILLGFSLLPSGWAVTALQMGASVLLGVLMRFLLTRLGLLHVPRSAVMITFVVLVFLALSAVMSQSSGLADVGAVVLPLAALAMMVEKFTLVAMDKGNLPALGLLAQTLLLALGCRLIMITPFFQNLTIAFPEVLLLVMAMIILLGNYRGLRWREVWRFRRVDAPEDAA